jgi:predicted DCC family thiol-disulfide oxidoreductase YuxK
MKRDKHILLFDSDCPMCTFQSRTLSWLDWFGRVEMVPLKDDRAGEIAPDITRGDLLEAIHCITPAGDIHRGARAIRFLGLRIPLLVPVGLFLWIPGVILVAEKIYAFVSRNRHFFSRIFGCEGACAILPERHDREIPKNPNTEIPKETTKSEA